MFKETQKYLRRSRKPAVTQGNLYVQFGFFRLFFFCKLSVTREEPLVYPYNPYRKRTQAQTKKDR